MRHGKKFNHLSRKTAHRKAMLANMACSLIEHKRINTTVAKAKALRQYVEPLITKSKSDTTHNRRIVFRNLRDKYAVAELFRDVAVKVGERPGGYVRIIKMGNRQGDNADMAMVELVDYNEIYNPKGKKKKSTRRRGGKKKVEVAESTAVAETKPEVETKPDVEAKSEVEAKPDVEAKSNEETTPGVDDTPKVDVKKKDDKEK